jgi:hypothetical protein
MKPVSSSVIRSRRYKNNNKCWKWNRLKAFVNWRMWDFVVLLYRVSQKSLYTYPSNDKTASFLALVITKFSDACLQAHGGHFQYLLWLKYEKCICNNAQGLSECTHRLRYWAVTVGLVCTCTDIVSAAGVMYMLRCGEFHRNALHLPMLWVLLECYVC